ncbi:MAG: sensor histidine kinase [Anaerolineae bacterium]
MNQRLAQLWRELYQRLTLRQWLSLWAGGLMLACTIVLVVAINVAAALTLRSPVGYAVPPLLGAMPTWQPGQPTPTPMVASGESPMGAKVSLVLQASLQKLRLISFVSLTVVAVLGSAGTYWLARYALRPVRELSQAASSIGPDRLGTRLALQGPKDEVRELGEAFDDMLARLEHAFTQQGRFVSDAAHELRTPLSTIRTALEVTTTSPEATLADYQEMAATVGQMLARLERLVADLLVLTTAERPLAFEEVALEPLVAEVADDLAGLADQSGVKLIWQAERDPVVRGHGPLLARALANLVENGIRYNRLGGQVRVEVARADDNAVIVVSDTGIGIAPEEQAHIFERFYRAEGSRSRHKGGAGLGLSIVNLVVQRHGGRVEVQSIPGEGSTFKVYLPLAG